MSTTPRPKDATSAAPLNPALKQGHADDYGPDQQGRDPMETISVKKPEGGAWPLVWAAAVIGGVLITLALLFG